MLILSSLLIGSTCSPSEPGCEYGESCGEPGEAVRSCINFCVPVYNEPVLDDVFCALDPCDAEVLENDEVWRCPPADEAGQAYRCAPFEDSPEPGRIGKCAIADGPLDLCEPGGPNTCTENLFCLNVEACPEEAELASDLGIPSDAAGYCWTPAREGEPCTGNVGQEDPGCRPCETGTWCREDPDYGNVCVRGCGRVGDPRESDPGLCGCSQEEQEMEEVCKKWEDAGFDEPRDGEPFYYCSVVDLPNGSSCEPDGRPCEEGECQSTTHPIHGGERTICCLEDGEVCDSDTDCCLGRSTCYRDEGAPAGECMPCGQNGDEPTDAGCCQGFVPVDGICRSCSVSREGRDYRMGGASCQGEFVQFETSDGTTATFAVPVEGNTGAGVAQMPAGPDNPLSKVRYNLRPEHRLFVMQGDLTGAWNRSPGPGQHPPTLHPGAGEVYPAAGITHDHWFVQLPPNPPEGGVSEFDLGILPSSSTPLSTWESMRVYHAGACSQFLDWQFLITGLNAAINRFLVDPQFKAGAVTFGSTPLSLVAAEITPILSSGSGSFGRSSENDQVNIVLEYQALGDGGHAFGCPEGKLRLNLGLRIRREPAVAPTLASDLADRTLTRPFTCGSDVCICEKAGDHYTCADSAGGVFSLARDLRTLTDAYDFRPEIVFLDGGVVDCDGVGGFNDLFTGIIADKLDAFLPDVLADLTANLDVDLPNSDLRIDYEDLTDYAQTDPDTGEVFGSDAICANETRFGGRRHECLNVGPGDANEYRCAGLRMDIQRINMRPDGLEVVLADDTGDPQYLLILATHESLCRDNRPGAYPRDENRDPVPPDEAPRTKMRRRTSLILSLTNSPEERRICHPDDPLVPGSSGQLLGCEGLCGDNVPLASTLPCDHDVRGVDRDNDRCYVRRGDDQKPHSVCCDPANFCPHPEGDAYFSEEDAPPEGRLWRCVNPNTDEDACGGCGIVCDVSGGEGCCGGVCQDLESDPAHCGRCNHACAGGMVCTEGLCCPLGQLGCEGACMDPSTSDEHCGACGNACPSGEWCTDGACCSVGQQWCRGACVSVQDDPMHCGACGIACAAGEACTNGVCCSGPDDPRDCDGDGVCEAFLFDASNCGGCGIVCAGPCIGGTCY